MCFQLGRGSNPELGKGRCALVCLQVAHKDQRDTTDVRRPVLTLWFGVGLCLLYEHYIPTIKAAIVAGTESEFGSPHDPNIWQRENPENCPRAPILQPHVLTAPPLFLFHIKTALFF